MRRALAVLRAYLRRAEDLIDAAFSGRRSESTSPDLLRRLSLTGRSWLPRLAAFAALTALVVIGTLALSTPAGENGNEDAEPRTGLNRAGDDQEVADNVEAPNATDRDSSDSSPTTIATDSRTPSIVVVPTTRASATSSTRRPTTSLPTTRERPTTSSTTSPDRSTTTRRATTSTTRRTTTTRRPTTTRRATTTTTRPTTTTRRPTTTTTRRPTTTRAIVTGVVDRPRNTRPIVIGPISSSSTSFADRWTEQIIARRPRLSRLPVSPSTSYADRMTERIIAGRPVPIVLPAGPGTSVADRTTERVTVDRPTDAGPIVTDTGTSTTTEREVAAPTLVTTTTVAPTTTTRATIPTRAIVTTTTVAPTTTAKPTTTRPATTTAPTSTTAVAPTTVPATVVVTTAPTSGAPPTTRRPPTTRAPAPSTTVKGPAGPVARKDRAKTGMFDPVTIPVLKNDGKVYGQRLTVTAPARSKRGARIEVNKRTNQITYTADPRRWWSAGAERFTYRVTDESGRWSEATVSVDVEPTFVRWSRKDRNEPRPLIKVKRKARLFLSFLPRRPTDIYRVEFRIDDRLVQIETQPYYDLGSSVTKEPSGGVLGFDTAHLGKGTHGITARVVYDDGTASTHHATFEVF